MNSTQQKRPYYRPRAYIMRRFIERLLDSPALGKWLGWIILLILGLGLLVFCLYVANE
jgi:hypothetical protein